MFRRQIPGARLIIYPGVGHDVIEEAPAVSEGDAAAFLSRVGWLSVAIEFAVESMKVPTASLDSVDLDS
jgi:hypothetical protein